MSAEEEQADEQLNSCSNEDNEHEVEEEEATTGVANFHQHNDSLLNARAAHIEDEHEQSVEEASPADAAEINLYDDVLGFNSPPQQQPPAETTPSLDKMDMSQVLQEWESNFQKFGFDPVPTLKRLADIFEKETAIYMRKDPDPFDGRHPYRSDPSCQLGTLLKQLFRKDTFMNRLVQDYLRDNYFSRQNVQRSSLELNVLACRLILVISPGLEISAVFQPDNVTLVQRIYSWADEGIEPLLSYATGLLAAAMEVNEIAIAFRDNNARLVPKMIKRLHMLQAYNKSGLDVAQSLLPNSETKPASFESILPQWMTASAATSPTHRIEDSGIASVSYNGYADVNNSNMSVHSALPIDNSRDGGTHQAANFYKKMFIPIYPPTQETSEMLIMRYLTSMGEYQEYLCIVLEEDVISLIFGYIENLDRRDTCLAFEALKYLASLLCHKKFALEFIARGGLELLLKVPRPSIAATGVSITLYYLAYCEDAMERICAMPKPIIRNLVSYALWLLERSYDSGKCHATMFFGLSFQFKTILDEFDEQDGIRTMTNVISILKILNPTTNEEENVNSPISDDVECASRQLVRHVCVALKRYMESHLFYRYNNFMRQQCPTSSEFSRTIVKASKANFEQISEQVRILQENTSVRVMWAPVENLLRLGGIHLLLKIISLSYDWNSNGRTEMLRAALDVLAICCVVPKVNSAFCERMFLPESLTTSGMFSILGAAAGDIIGDADVQKSALAVLCNCVCAPVVRKDRMFNVLSSNKKQKPTNKYMEELLQNAWEAVCSNNGIIVLLSLMQIKAPITDADCIRGMACRALAGLARSERVRQIVGKLPLFASGQIQTLMRDPILQEKRAEHVLFQKYALELLELLSGKQKPLNTQMDSSLSNIHKANVVAQTKIQYNEQQLLQLIHDHLEFKGLAQTAQMLQKEANLPAPSTVSRNFHQSPFDYKTLPTPTVRNRLRNRMQDLNADLCTSNLPEDDVPSSSYNHILHNQNANTPIKLVKKSDKHPVSNHQTSSTATTNTVCINSPLNSQRSLQKHLTPFDEILTDSSNNTNATNSYSNSTGITLSTIVTEYLTNQHALCNNPMTTCPQFDLFTPHKCPDPKSNRVLHDSVNLTARLFKAQAGYNTARMDRRYVHTKFATWRTIRAVDYSETQYSCCDLAHNTRKLYVGTNQGDAKIINVNDASEIVSWHCHNYMIESIKSNRNCDLLITSCSWRVPLSTLWSIENNTFSHQLNFTDDFYCEFSNLTQDRILGTQHECAVIYDIKTGSKISTFTPTIPNQYTRNRATFDPRDELILSDGVLWDVKSGIEIHKFDKLNQTLSGIFHPNGLEIISNTEVWDLRTFHLLQTVPVLEQCHINFSPMRVLYAINLENEIRTDFEDTTGLETSFKVLDAYDYSSITTIDVKRTISDISVNGNGSVISLVESQPAYDSKQETFVRIYAVGMHKNEQTEEEEEENDSDEDSDGDSDSRGHAANFMDSENSMDEEEAIQNNEDDADDNDDNDNGNENESSDSSSNWIDIDASSDGDNNDSDF